MKKEYPDILKIEKAKGHISHRILIDDKYFRMESAHKTDDSGKLIVRNLVIEKPPRIIAMHLISQFDTLWNNAVK